MNAGNVYKPFLVLFLAFLFINATSSGILNANKRPEAVPLMDKVTFRVDMTGLAVNPAGMYLASDFASTIGLTNWAQLPMCNIGGGLWEISFCGIPPGTYQYKFLNGPNGWEFDGFGGPCTNPADNNNRFVTVTGGMQLAGPFVLSSCTMTNNAGGADVTPPVITGPVPANTTVTCGNPLPAAMPLSASDGCDANCTLFTGMPVDNTSGLNACGLGAIIRTWTATDCAGNTATATQTITLIDNTPPTITGPAPGPITVGCAALPPAVPLPASDACDATVTSTGPPVDNTSGLNACGVGVIQRTWTVADCSGNSTSVTQAITLQDNAPPVITGAIPANITVVCGAIPPAVPLAATDDCDASVVSTGPPVDNTSGLNACGVGVIQRTWTVADCSGNSTSVTQSITVQDATPPMITGPVPANITVSCGAIPPAGPLPASDNCDASVSSTGPPVDDLNGLGPCGVGTVLRTWTVADCSGNSTSVTQTITVSDAQLPTIFNAPADITLNCGSPLPPASPLVASDNCDPTVTTTGPPAEDNSGLGACGLGVIQRIWSVADCSGNTAIAIQSITLADAAPPVITQPVPANVVVDCNGALPPAVPLAASDDCDPGAFQTEVPLDDLSGLDACGTGVIQRSWTVSDCSGNTTVATQTITVVDLEAPVILDAVPADVTVSCLNMPAAAPLAAFDLCDGNIFSTGIPVDDLSGLGACGAGEVVRTWTVTDCAGNTTSASQIITLVDAGPPTIDDPVPANITVNCIDLPPAQPLAASDDCDGNVVSTGMPVDDLAGLNACGVGAVMRTWTVSDCSGNTASVFQVITVEDNTPPVLAVPADGTFNCDAIPSAAAAVTSATDDCSTPTIVYDGETIVGGGCPYEIHRTWTATDACGNAVSQTQVITVQDTVAPVFVNSPQDMTVCEGSLPPLASLNWADNCDGAGTVNGTESTNGLNNPEIITRAWAFTDACGNTVNHTQTITVVAAPAVNAGEDRSICEGSHAALSATVTGGADTTFWSSMGDGTFDGTSSPDALYTPGPNDLAIGQAALVFSARPAAANCPAATDTVVVNFVPLPSADAGPGQEITCDVPSVTIGTPGVVGMLYEWSGPGIDDNNRNNPTPVVGAPGQYILNVTAAGTACSVFDTVLVSTDTGFPVAAAGGNQEVNCIQTEVTLDGSGSSVGADFTLSWSGPGIDGSNQNQISPVVTQPGMYTLTVSNTANGCTATAEVSVLVDTLPPVADAGSPQLIDCNNPIVALGAGNSSAGTDIIYQWLAPNGAPLGSGAMQAVTQEGIYSLVVRDTTNGCSDMAIAEVLIDTLPPVANAGPDRTLTCTEPSITLNAGGTSVGGQLAFEWRRDGTPVGVDSTLDISVPGIYTLLVVNTSNGCSRTDEVLVTENTSAPVADAGTGGLLTCTDNCLVLGGANTSAGPNFTYEWMGAAHAVANANAPAPEVCAPDTYTLVVTNTDNGCTATDVAAVAEDASLPTAVARSNDTLSCEVAEVVLSGAGSTSGTEIEYQWRDDSGQLISTGLEATVASPGLYSFTVINTQTQCQSSTVAQAFIDTLPPLADAGAGLALDCAHPSVMLGSGAVPQPGVQYQWQDANGNILGTGLNQPASVPGLYTLLVVDTGNGCSATDEVFVTDNVIYPLVDAGANRTLNCINGTAFLDGSGSSAGGGFAYSWSGPGFSSTEVSPQINTGGTYVLSVTNTSNSCSATDTVAVALDTIAPIADAGPDGLLTCAVTDVQLDGAGSDQGAGLAYAWTDVSGAVVGNGLALPVNTPGIYQLSVTNTLNGCTAADEVVVEIDTVAPAAMATVNGLLTCIQNQVTLDGTGSDAGNNLTFLWSGPGVAGDSSLPVAAATEPGLYTLTVANTLNGCSAFATAEARQDTTPPMAFAGPAQELTCLEPLVTLQGGASSPGATFLWSGPGINLSNETIPGPTVGQPGLYGLVVVDTANGCSSAPAMVSVADNRALPLAEAGAGGNLDCRTPTALLDGSNSAQGDTIFYQWYFNGQAMDGATTAQWEVDAAGEYIIEVRNSSTGCSNTDTVTVGENTDAPAVRAEGATTLNCYQPVVSLTETASAGLPNHSLEWLTFGGNIVSANTNGPAVEVDAAGLYIVTVRNLENGCEQSDTVRVEEDREQPDLSLEESYRLDCREGSVTIAPLFSGSAGELEFEWSGPGFAADAVTVGVSQPGTYTLVATLLRTGCQATASTMVLGSVGVDQVDVEVSSPDCPGEANGFIQVGTVSGGVPPFLFALDGGPFMAEPSLGPLAPGNYLLIVQDAEGCELEQMVTIPEAEPFSVSLGEDIELVAGDSVQLAVQPSGAVRVYTWLSPDESSISCRDCPAPVVAPTLTTVYTLVAESEEGCRAEDAILVRVIRRDDVYTPNAFSPNGDGKNDYFTLYTRHETVLIRKLEVFDRWGNLLFEAENIPGSVPELGWDGKFRGNEMDGGLYLFWADLALPDGRTKLVSGEVMLMR